MQKDFAWSVRVSIIQTRSRGENIEPNLVFVHTYEVQNDHALSICEGLQELVNQERDQ